MPPRNKKQKKSKSKSKMEDDKKIGGDTTNTGVSTAEASTSTTNEPAQQASPSVASSTTTLPFIGPLPWFGPTPPRPMFPNLGDLGPPFSSLGINESAFPNLGEALQTLGTTPATGQASSKNPLADLGLNPDYSDTSSKFASSSSSPSLAPFLKSTDKITCVVDANMEKIGRDLAKAILAKPVTEQPPPDDMTVDEEAAEAMTELMPSFERIIAAYLALGERRAKAKAAAEAKAKAEEEGEKKGGKKDEPEPEGA